MKYIKNTRHEGDNEAAVRILIELGFKKPAARVLVYLLSHQEASMWNIEIGASLHQPEVSVATADLLKRGWISYRLAQGPGKGRPVKIFRNAKPVNEILAVLEEEKQKEVRNLMQNLERLHVLVRKFGNVPQSCDSGLPATRTNMKLGNIHRRDPVGSNMRGW